MNISKIEWCKYTWNPVTGCYNGCPYCYAAKIVHRFVRADAECDNCSDCPECSGKINRGDCPDFRKYIPRERIHVLDAKKIGFFPKKHYINFPYGFEPTLHRYRLQEPGEVKTPSSIFVCSMADLFGAFIPDEWIFEVFKACAEYPQHRYMFLTKNPMRYFSLMDSGNLPKLNNMWYGTTITTEMDDFFYADGYNSFLSIEPIQGSITIPLTGIKWVIVGQETGNRKERIKVKPEWINGIHKTCIRAGIPVFMKNNLVGVVKNLIQEDTEND